jgi:hypothetical protein
MNWLKKLFSLDVQQSRKSVRNHPMHNIRNTDLAMFAGNTCCPVCSMYKFRVFSISGNDKRFPALDTLPPAIHDGRCDVCNCSYSLYSWYAGISSPDILTAVRKSYAPLVDRRTPEQIKEFEKKRARLARQREKQENNK